MMKPPARNTGSAIVEFTLVGIPLMFVLISTFEMARGMWLYHTLSYAVREATRFVIVHGQNCDPVQSAPNSCQVSVAQIAGVIRDAGVGLMPDQLEVSMHTASGPNPYPGGVPSAALNILLTNNNPWPTGPGSNRPNDVVVIARYPFRSALVFFWPGAGAPLAPGVIQLRATSREKIQF
ncbi:MAG: pilus assembly protein [Bryobacterales bacterium]|nr:pilus assembly protein [Bryobacterales bacterium]